jgi:hypothetical protein
MTENAIRQVGRKLKSKNRMKQKKKYSKGAAIRVGARVYYKSFT